MESQALGDQNSIPIVINATYCRAMLDSGASMNCICREWAKTLGLDKAYDFDIKDVRDVQGMSMITCGDIKVPIVICCINIEKPYAKTDSSRNYPDFDTLEVLTSEQLFANKSLVVKSTVVYIQQDGSDGITVINLLSKWIIIKAGEQLTDGKVKESKFFPATNGCA